MSKKPILKKKKISTDATRFAHLMKAEEDDTDQDNPAAQEGDDQEPDAEGDKQEPEDPKDQNGRAEGKKAKRAKLEEEDPKEPDAQGDDDFDAEDEGDDETDAEDDDDDTTAQARARERGRCAAIFGCKAAGNNLALAAELAFSTKLPRSQAIRVLKAGGIAKAAPTNKPSRASLYDQRVIRQRQSLSVDTSQQSQNMSKPAMLANKILQAAAGTGVVKKERQ